MPEGRSRVKYGRMIDGGRAYEINTPKTPGKWGNYLFNDTYQMEVSQTLQGKSSYLEGYRQEEFTEGYRYFYILDQESGEAFSPAYVPLRKPLDRFSCVHGVEETRLAAQKDGVQCAIRVFVPSQGMSECWKIEMKNLSGETKRLSLFSAIGFDDGGTMGGECTCDASGRRIARHAYPYHVYYEDKEKVEGKPSYYYMISDLPAASLDMSRRRFFGGDDIGELPAAVARGACSGIAGEAEAFLAAMQHSFVLGPGETAALRLRVGVCASAGELDALTQAWSAQEEERLSLENQARWRSIEETFSIRTPDAMLDAFVNSWLKKQCAWLTRLNRGGVYCPIRNQLQDAMGYALIDPQGAKEFIYTVLRRQKSDGFITQWYMTDGSAPKALCLLRHTDGPIWLMMALTFLVRQLGASVLDDVEPYEDGGESSVAEHLWRAAEYMLSQLGAHGLCLMGDGDWNDPINGPGRRGRGESVWSSMALVYVLAEIRLTAAGRLSPEREARLLEAERALKDAINTHAWVEDRYILAIDDDGVKLGAPQDQDRLFLNTQTWAVIAGIPDAEKRCAMQKSLERLHTPFGPLLLDPPFPQWDARWGRVSVKKSGTTENGSVYCHASMFKAFSDLVLGDGDAAYDTLWRTLPTNPENPPEVNGQIPIELPNYYYALAGSANYGRSSGNRGTGTVAWMLRVALEHFLGVQATPQGLRLCPCLPKAWDTAECTRAFRGARYHIVYRRGVCGVTVDGAPLKGDILPCEAGRSYEVVTGMDAAE